MDVRAGRQSCLNATDLAPVRPFVDGVFAPSRGRRSFLAKNPATGEDLCEFGAGSAEDVDDAVRSARTAFNAGRWRAMTPSARRAILRLWADRIEACADWLDHLDALTMGKPVTTQTFSARHGAGLVRFYAEAADKWRGEALASDEGATVVSKRVPRGIVAGIVSWNFPAYNFLLKAAPALAAGNCVIMKPSEMATHSALKLAELALEAGLPAGVLNVVPGLGSEVGRALAEHGDIDMVAFTGSSAVGKLVLRGAALSNMKASAVECGGKSPHVVVDDSVDLDVVADTIAAMITLNQGQICSVGSRVIVREDLHDGLLERVRERMGRVSPGDPQDAATNYGPLASLGQMEKILSYIDIAKVEGASLVAGGRRRPDWGEGYFVEPTIFTKVAPDSRLACEEVFGPVLAFQSFRTLEEAAAIADVAPFGLAAYVWTKASDSAWRLANKIRSGFTLLSGGAPLSEGAGFGLPLEPAGLSGLGVEGGLAGLETYMRRHTIWLNHGV